MKITEGQYLDALYIVKNYLKQIEKEINLEDEFLDMEVLHYRDLSVRCQGVIYGYKDYVEGELTNIGTTLTFRQLKLRGAKHLMYQRNCGKKTLEELRAIFKDNGYEF